MTLRPHAWLFLIALTCLASTASAEEAQDEEEHHPWTLTLQPHMSFSFVSEGDAEVDGIEFEFGTGVGDTLGYGARLELVSPWRLGAVVDVYYTENQQDVDRPVDIQVPTGTIPAQASSAQIERLSVDALLTCHITTFDLGPAELELSAAGGLALVYYATQLDVRLTNGPSATLREVEQTVELVLGLDVGLLFAEGTYAILFRGDLGGFGIADASELTWKAVLSFRWRPLDWFSVETGYRGLYVEYEGPRERVVVEGAAHGLFLALNLHF